jgi:energy-coupling factor transporter ATP-binding protein EcfA2
MGITFKMLGTAMLWICTAILTKVHLAPNAGDWQNTLRQLPLWVLLSFAVGVPIAWLFVEFATTCFIEVRARLLEDTAPHFAEQLLHVPEGVYAVLGRWWDSCVACFGRCRFDGRYRRRVAEDCQRLHGQTGLLYATAGFSLEHVYTELNMASTQYGEIDQSILASRIRGQESIYGFLRVQQPGTVLALLGRPGGGKTTLLRHLALLFAKNKQGQCRLRRRIPVLIELRRVTELFAGQFGVEWKNPTLIQVIQHYWKQHSGFAGLMQRAPKDWLHRHLTGGRVLVMVDGLDEIPHRVDSSDPVSLTARQRVSQWLENEMQKEGHRNCLFLITSRPGGFAEAPLQRRVTVLEVQPLTLEQSGKFIYAFQLGCQRHGHPTASACKMEFGAAVATERLEQELRAKPHLSDLRVNPLLLHMVCLLHYLRGRLPIDRSDLYKETCEILLNRDLRAPGIEELLRPSDKLAALRPLADYFMRSESRVAKSTDELLTVIAPVFDTLNFSARDFFDYIAKDSGLLQEVERGRWDFAHKTFYEYLAAEHWEKHPPAVEDLAEWVEQDWWRVTLLFYSARSEDSPVITAALKSQSPKAWSLAFACLSAGHRLNADARSRAEAKLQMALSDPADEPAFIPAAQALFDLRMRDLVSASPDGTWLKRATLITQAEYQLFLLSCPLFDRHLFFPPHWNNPTFSGEPTSPILGITPYQALVFSQWAARVSEQPWDLPDFPHDNLEIPDGSWQVYKGPLPPGSIELRAAVSDKAGTIRTLVSRWAQSTELPSSSSSSWEQMLASHDALRPKTTPKNLRVDFIPPTWMRRSPEIAIIQNRKFCYDRGIIGLAVVFEIELAAFVARTGSVPRSAQRSEYHNFRLNVAERELDLQEYWKLGDNLVRKLKPEQGQELALVLHEAARRADASGFEEEDDPYLACRAMTRGLANPAEIDSPNGVPSDSESMGDKADQLIDKLEKAVLRAEGVGESYRLRILANALSVLATRNDPIAHVPAWRQHGLCLAELCIFDCCVKNPWIESFYWALRLLEDRARGELEPWERIALLRKA